MPRKGGRVWKKKQNEKSLLIERCFSSNYRMKTVYYISSFYAEITLAKNDLS